MATEINDVLRKTEGWKQPRSPMRIKRYGLQKGFKRINKIVNIIWNENLVCVLNKYYKIGFF